MSLCVSCAQSSIADRSHGKSRSGVNILTSIRKAAGIIVLWLSPSIKPTPTTTALTLIDLKVKPSTSNQGATPGYDPSAPKAVAQH
jgi:hypothetical protein